MLDNIDRLSTKSHLMGERRSWRDGADCKSVAVTLSWFESILTHHYIQYKYFGRSFTYMTPINLGLYGHSSASRIDTDDDVSWIDQVRKRNSVNIVNLGKPQGSEERIMFELIKTKKLDAAIIFHSPPRYIFIPNAKRDVSITAVPENKSVRLWLENDMPSEDVTQDMFDENFFSYGNIKNVFGTADEFIDAMHTYKQYFYHPDLLVYRYRATAMAIDDYLFNKKIKCLHVMNKNLVRYFSWYTFRSGPLQEEMSSAPMSPGLPNNLSVDVNNRYADIVSDWLSSM